MQLVLSVSGKLYASNDASGDQARSEIWSYGLVSSRVACDRTAPVAGSTSIRTSMSWCR